MYRTYNLPINISLLHVPIMYKYYPNYFIYAGLHSSLTYFVNREAKISKTSTGSVPVRICTAIGRLHTNSTLVSTLIRSFISQHSIYAVGTDI